MRLIDADQLLKHKGDCYDINGHLLYAVGTGDILKAPTIEVEPIRHGHWAIEPKYYCSEDGTDYPDLCVYLSAKCSECGENRHSVYHKYFSFPEEKMYTDDNWEFDIEDCIRKTIEEFKNSKTIIGSNYCSNCGVKMDGSENND